MAFWWHGCEHIPQADLETAIANLERMATFMVVLGCPRGHSPQGPEYGNSHETHCWDVHPSDLERLGLHVVQYDPPHRQHILAWGFLA